MTTAEAIKAIRDKMGLSQQKFSERLNSTLMTVSRWERDLYVPVPQKLVELVELARENGLTEAADTLSMESGAALQILAPHMTQKAWERFGQIAGRLLEFRHEMTQAGITSAVPDDLWRGLGKALELANIGKDDMARLTAMLSKLGPKP
jgi:transcriptional regulator with XRE-family HTH domain